MTNALALQHGRNIADKIRKKLTHGNFDTYSLCVRYAVSITALCTAGNVDAL